MVRLHNHIRRHPSVRSDGIKCSGDGGSQKKNKKKNSLADDLKPQRTAKEELKLARAHQQMIRDKMRRAEANYKRMLAMQLELESAAAVAQQ